MITGLVRLHTTDLDDNLQLIGEKNDPVLNYSVRDLLGGGLVIQTDIRDAAPALALTAVNEGTRRVGQYCSYQLDELRSAAASGVPVTLSYHGETRSVMILEFQVTQTDERELPGPNKKYYGSILIQQIS